MKEIDTGWLQQKKSLPKNGREEFIHNSIDNLLVEYPDDEVFVSWLENVKHTLVGRERITEKIGTIGMASILSLLLILSPITPKIFYSRMNSTEDKEIYTTK